MTLSPNVWNVGDTAHCMQGRHSVTVRVCGFKHDLVVVEYADRTRGLRAHSVLRRDIYKSPMNAYEP